ncbi:restriction endonuclease subunit S, partial [Agrobacterium sp. S2]|nr:restriction endonuclease subunit S [Agrobacterium sp. S2]
IVEPGALLVGMDGDFNAATWHGPTGLLNQRVCRIDVDSERYDRRFLEYALQGYLDAIWKATSSTTVKHLSSRSIADIPLPNPPREEQRRIVDILEDHLSRLNAANDYLDAAERRLDRLALARWRSVFGALTETLGQRPLLDVVVIENGQTPRGLADRLLNYEADGSVPFYKVGDMNASEGRQMAAARFHARRQDARELGLHVRQGGLVLIPKRGGAISTNKKRLLTSAAAFDLNTMGLRPKPGLSPEYLWHWLEGIDLGQIADGS